MHSSNLSFLLELYHHSHVVATARPAYHLPGSSKAAIAVRFSPVLYTLRRKDKADDEGTASVKKDSGQPLEVEKVDAEAQAENAEYSSSLVQLPYRMVFAVATLDSIIVYDSESQLPLAYLEGIHFAQLTDISWYTA